MSNLYNTYAQRIDAAATLDALNAVIEDAANSIDSNSEYEALYLRAIEKARAWNAPFPAPADAETDADRAEAADANAERDAWLASLPECTRYARGIAIDIEDAANGVYEEDGEPCDLFDYLTSNALDIEYTLDSTRELIGVQIYVTLGGPTCWIDTRRAEVVCHWGSDCGRWGISAETCDAINDFEREVFNS